MIANLQPEEVMRWAYEKFGGIAIVASFQAESSVIIDMASKIRPDIRVLTPRRCGRSCRSTAPTSSTRHQI